MKEKRILERCIIIGSLFFPLGIWFEALGFIELAKLAGVISGCLIGGVLGIFAAK